MIYSKAKMALGYAAAILLTAGAINVAVSKNSDENKTSVGEASTQEQSFANELIKATADQDYSTFISHGDAGFKTLTKSDFKSVCSQVTSHLKGGYHVVFLGGLQQGGAHVTLWKVTFDNSADDDVLTMVVHNGKIAGAMLTPPFH